MPQELPTILHRHPWTARFTNWLVARSISANAAEIARPDGTDTSLLLGDFADPTRQIVLFLHGLGNDLFFPNIAFFKSLLTSGYNVMALDLDGHGLGQSSIFDETSLKTMIPSALCVLDQRVAPGSKIHLCGFSFGAALALAHVQRHPGTVASLMMIGMPGRPKASPKLITEALSPANVSWWRALNDYGFSGIHPAIGSFRRSLYPVRLAAEESRSYLEVAGHILASLNTEALLPNLPIPSLGITGMLDFIAIRDMPAIILGQKNLSWKTIPRANHLTTMLAPETARYVCEFLRTVA